MTTTLEDLRNAVADLARYESENDGSDLMEQAMGALDRPLLQRYEQARNAYLKNQTIRTLFQYVTTFDGQNFETPAAITEEEHIKQEEMKERVLQEMTDKVNVLRQSMTDFARQKAAFLAEREQVQHLVQELEAKGNGNFDATAPNDYEAEEDVTDEDLAQAAEKIQQLKERKQVLLAKIDSVKRERMQVQMKMKQQKATLEHITKENDLDENQLDVDTLRMENEKLAKEKENLQEIKDYYDGLRSVMEEMLGYRALSIENATSPCDGEDVHVTIRFFDSYDLLIGLKSSKKRKGTRAMSIVFARFVSPAVVTGVQQPEGQTKLPPVSIKVPDPEDLVRIAESLPAGEDFRFLVRETRARITTLQARVDDLTALQHMVLVKIGKFYHYNHGHGGEDQNVVCSLSEQITVVLRLTPDCPMLQGSVYIDQLVGLGGWDSKLLDAMKDKINRQEHQTSVSLIQAVNAEINQLQKEGMEIPGSPLFPSRRGTS